VASLGTLLEILTKSLQRVARATFSHYLQPSEHATRQMRDNIKIFLYPLKIDHYASIWYDHNASKWYNLHTIKVLPQKRQRHSKTAVVN
jgi:hypothetical protein